jgi:hypothetical protein
MSDQDRTKQREHWQAIAEQLGLSADPELPPSAGATPTATEKSLSEPAHREERQEKFVSPREEPLTPSTEQDRDSRSLMQQQEPDRPEIQAADQEEEGLTNAEDKPESPAKTRRGRRGRGTRDKGAVEGKEGEARLDEELSSAESAEKAARPSRRGSGLGRGKKERVASREKERTQPADSEDDDSDELSSLKDWNVPSWNELIASLYRPER